MKLRLPERMSPRTGWIVVACLAAPFVLLFLTPFAYVGLSLYWQWHQGYGLACESNTLAETYSPSRRWIAKARVVTCSGLADGQWVEAVLVPNAALPFLVQHRRVFVRDITRGELRPGDDRLSVRWIDDHSVELEGTPCSPCQSKDLSCASRCGIVNEVSGVTISFKPTER